MNVAIVTARALSKSIIDKNVYPVDDRSMVQFPIQAARDAARTDSVYVSTDGDKIAAASEAAGATVIPRPDELGGDAVNHGEVIKHAVEWVDERVDNLQNVVLLLGNTVMISGELIDHCLEILETRSELDSVMTVWEAGDDHPLRALEIRDGLITPYGGGPREVSTERQSYPKAYYYDQGVWAFRKQCVQQRKGPNPWWWMGEKVHPVVRMWTTGRDVHSPFDIGVHKWWLAEGHQLQTEADGIDYRSITRSPSASGGEETS